MRKILGVFEIFLGVFEKTKEKKDRTQRPQLENWEMTFFQEQRKGGGIRRGFLQEWTPLLAVAL